MKRSKLKYYYTLNFGDCTTIFYGMSTTQYSTLKLDYAFDCATYKFIRDEKK